MLLNELGRTTLLMAAFVAAALADVIALDGSNFDTILKSNELVFVNFYADWCRFSQQLKPIFLEASNKFKDRPAGQVVWGSVDADRNPDIAARFHVNKYPTLKLYRNGDVVKKEYRSSRSVESLSEFVTKQLETTVKLFANPNDLNQAVKHDRRTLFAYFKEASGAEFDNLKKVASLFRDDCDFIVGIGSANFPSEVPADSAHPKLVYQPPNTASNQVPVEFQGDYQSYEYVRQWISEKCVPLVREITFQNAEELTEEGLPFLILFKHPDDQASEKIFTDAVIREIPDQRTAVNCLVADGKKFAHPLHHLGKSEADLPVIAIDSFRHMYLFAGYDQLNAAGKLRQFVLDLHSGKLHREFHHGPDAGQQNDSPETQPPPSVFEKLKPSHNRYTILEKTEL